MEQMESTQPQGDLTSTEDIANALMARRESRPEPVAEPEQPAEELEALAEEVLEEPETEEVEPDLDLAEEQQEADDPTPDAEGDEAEGAERFETIDQLAEATGLELDDFLNSINVNTKVNGSESSVTLAQLVKGHQLESSFTAKNQAWLEEKEATNKRLEAERSKLTNHFQLATTAFNLAQQELMSDFQGINWNQLQQENPSEWAAKRQQFGERQAKLNQAKDQSAQQIQLAVQQQEAERAEATDQQLQQEHKTLLEKVPTWNDEKVRAKEAAEIAEYLDSIGFAADEISSLKDHKLIILARAALGQQGPSKKKLALAKKVIKSTPKLVKPGSQRPSNGATTSAQKATAKANKTGNIDDVTQALIERANARQAKQKARRRT